MSIDPNDSSKNSGIILYTQPDGRGEVSLMARDGSVWLTQNQIAELFGTSKQNVGQHIANILKDKELDEISVVKNYFTTAADGKNYATLFYSLDMILAIGFRVRGVRGVQFRQWANLHLKEFLIKGFILDDNRLKNPDGRPDYFDELLSRIRDIRASEKRFYQKVRELFALSSDYDQSDKSTEMFFAETQNKLLYAITGQTAAEIIVSRANADQNNMGLTSWKGSIVRKQDILIAKNYLSAEEIDELNHLAVIFLESAELRVKNRQDLTLDYWRSNVDRLLEFNDKEVLRGKGKISNERMKEIVSAIYEQYDDKRKHYEAQLADLQDLEELKKMESELKDRKNNDTGKE
ncbi:MAG: virulence RhuM family protein [Planctomycetia bacterium]|nr:virulence RhuM family protein [Planctomycetia bacterium]